MDYEPRPHSDDFDKMKNDAKQTLHTWTEQIELAADQVVDRTKELVREGNVRTIRFKHDGKTLIEMPVTAAAAVGAVATLLAPQLTIIGAIAGALAKVTVEIEHTGAKPVETETKNNLSNT